MKLHDMKVTPAERKKREKELVPSPSLDGDEYPWGLRLDLNADALKKLGIETLPKVGTTMHLEARVSVIATRQSSRAKGKDDRSLELQIERLGLTKAPQSMMDAVDDGLDEAG